MKSKRNKNKIEKILTLYFTQTFCLVYYIDDIGIDILTSS